MFAKFTATFKENYVTILSCQVELKPASFWWLSGSQHNSRGEPPLIISDWLDSTLAVSDWSNEKTPSYNVKDIVLVAVEN